MVKRFNPKPFVITLSTTEVVLLRSIFGPLWNEGAMAKTYEALYPNFNAKVGYKFETTSYVITLTPKK